MKNTNQMTGKPATVSDGVTETQRQEEYRRAWESHLNDFKRLLWNLSEEQQQEFEVWRIEGRRLIAFATVGLKEAN